MTEPASVAEAVFEAISMALDKVSPAQTELFLCKLCLLLALETGDPGQVARAIAAARLDLAEHSRE